MCRIHDQIGGPAVMKSQLDKLIEIGELPNVSIRMVPFDAAGHLGSRVGSFVLMKDAQPQPITAETRHRQH